MALVELFGEKLLTKDGEKPTVEALAGKTAIGIYLSAHWCPPCRGFTPKLGEMFKSAFEAKGMAIVFVSSDKDEAAFKSYYGEMPWMALPYAARVQKEILSKRFKVEGIPSLVIVNPAGETITTDGRSAVMDDPKGEKYPWIPPTPAEKAKMNVDALGDLVAAAGGKPIGLYFSAHWCPPCRGFTPKLAEFYNSGLKDKMEIIFVSSDKDEAQFKKYHGEMPWPALPYAKRKERDLLSNNCGVEGIPTLVVLNPDGTVITTDGRSKVEKDPKGENFPEAWLLNDDSSDEDEEEAADCPDYFYVCKKTIESLQEKLKKSEEISQDLVSKLFSPDNIPDEDIMVPVDMRGIDQAFEDIDEILVKLGPKAAAEAFLKAKAYFDANKDDEPEEERPKTMTAAEWKEVLNDSDDEGEEEEDLEDEDLEDPGDKAGEPDAKKARTG